MTAFNVVRFRVKPGGEQEFIDAHRKARMNFKGFIRGNLIQTGSQTFCIIGEWRNRQSMLAANPQMIGVLDSFRHLLEDLGGGLGVTDPVSGESVVQIAASKPAKKAVKTKSKKKAKAAPKKKTKAKKRRR